MAGHIDLKLQLVGLNEGEELTIYPKARNKTYLENCRAVAIIMSNDEAGAFGQFETHIPKNRKFLKIHKVCE